MKARPNVVVFVPDQLRADAVGAFGNDVVSTPVIDALAARGARFSNAYAQHPVCSPSRASFLTGWYPHVRGHRSLTYLLESGEPNFLKTFKDNGYEVVWAGERGDTFAPGATEESVDAYGFSVPPTGMRWAKDLTYRDEVAARLFLAGKEDDAESVDFDEAAIRTAERWLATRPPEPWVLFVPLLAPHVPFRSREPWHSMYDPAAMPDPAPVPGPQDGPEPRFHQAIRAAYGIEDVPPETWREVTAAYYAMISRMDAHLGRVLAAVAAAGAADDTITAFFADHGEYLGDYGLVEKWPTSMTSNILRNPLVLAGPGIPEGVVVDDMVELIDVFPTLLDLAGVPDDTHRHYGRSLVPRLRGDTGEHRSLAFSEGGFTVEEEPQFENAPFPYDAKTDLQHAEPSLVGKAVAVRDRRWSYVHRLYAPPELYDREADPGELVNLAGRPEVADVEGRLRDAVLRWLLETADVLPLEPHPRRPVVTAPVPRS
ncbi:Arylsulfatase A [Nonomuraea solani]|uniref:Arylsulfatase A n=1 Tax=Nonomuraea solani TaxID=1144553 RepID=A0A1H6EWF1_9ACTN|nr:sulfatase-like hydrolase/transferase [Nonomuraea solani]SEH02167.1 Arylsulfatase A [Nonomuraea solani]